MGHGVQLEQGGAEVGGVDGEDGHAAAGELRHAGQVPSPDPGGGAYIHRQQLGGENGVIKGQDDLAINNKATST